MGITMKTAVNASFATLALALTALSTPAMAHEVGDFVVRAGAALAQPEDSSSAISINGIGKVAGTGAGVGNDTQLGLTASYIVAPHWGIELLASTPFEHEITGKGLGGFGVDKLGTTKHLPPTLSLQYYFAAPQSAWQPYVGVGINYTLFFSESVSREAKTGLGASDLQLDDSVGLALEAGLDWTLADHWLVNVSVWKADMDTTATVNTALGKAKVDVDIDPWVYMVAVGYRF
jgi:outer membrane protein